MASIEPSSGYDFIAINNVGPKTAGSAITFYTAKSAGTAYGALDGVNSRLQINRIGEYTGGANIQFDHNIEFSPTNWGLFGTTSDGSDNASLTLSPATSANVTRGAYIILNGNEHGSTGQVQIRCGNVAGGVVQLGSTGTQDILFTTNNIDRWEVDGSTGAILPKSNNAYDIGSASVAVKDFYINGNIRSTSTINFTNQTTAGTAGALNQYWTVNINGTSFKIPCYNL